MAMSKNLHLIPGSDLDAATLNLSPAAVNSLPATNMQRQGRGRISRVLGSNLTIRANVVATTANGFAIANHNLENTGVVRVRLYDGENQTGNMVYDSGAQPIATLIPWGVMRPGLDPWGYSYDSVGMPKIFSLWFELTAYRSIRIDIESPTNDYIDIGRLFIGTAFVPSKNYNWGNELEWVDKSEHTRTAAGSLKTKQVKAYRRFTYQLSHLNNEERERLSYDLERRTKAGDVLICLNPAATGRTALEQTMIAKRVNNNSIATRHTAVAQTKHIFEEA